MKIGGFIKESLIDWPGKVVSLVFTTGCNFRCTYCHNPMLVIPELFDRAREYSEEFILDHLRNNKGWLDGVVISGGEPTIHHDLPCFIEKLKSLGYPVKLDTNGTNPDMIQALLEEKLIDCVAMDIKTVLSEEEYQRIIYSADRGIINRIKESIAVIKNSGIDSVFRTTMIPGHHNEETINKLKSVFSGENYILQEYRDSVTLSDYLYFSSSSFTIRNPPGIRERTVTDLPETG